MARWCFGFDVWSPSVVGSLLFGGAVNHAMKSKHLAPFGAEGMQPGRLGFSPFRLKATNPNGNIKRERLSATVFLAGFYDTKEPEVRLSLACQQMSTMLAQPLPLPTHLLCVWLYLLQAGKSSELGYGEPYSLGHSVALTPG